MIKKILLLVFIVQMSLVTNSQTREELKYAKDTYTIKLSGNIDNVEDASLVVINILTGEKVEGLSIVNFFFNLVKENKVYRSIGHCLGNELGENDRKMILKGSQGDKITVTEIILHDEKNNKVYYLEDVELLEL